VQSLLTGFDQVSDTVSGSPACARFAGMRRVLFVGAGASVPFGVPLTGEILPQAVLRLQSGGLFSNAYGRGRHEAEDEKFLQSGLCALYPGIELGGTKVELTAALPYITSVLSLLDYLIANEQPLKPGWDRARVARLRLLFDRALCEVLSRRGKRRSGPWRRLMEYLRNQIPDSSHHLTVITTNYDLTMDMALAQLSSPEGLAKIDLGFEFREVDEGRLVPRPGMAAGAGTMARRLALYKLHGSLNYLRCEVCDQVYMNPDGDISFRAFEREKYDDNTCHCGHYPLRHVIVAPSTVRSYRIPQVLSTWVAATEALRTAEEWVFAGYSLPAEDLAIRSMLFRAWNARGENTPSPGITVVQNSRQAEPAYRLLFGKVDYVEGGFENWLPDV
jgi:NAD-dependent SIR2 family protein deacetylase